MRCWQSNRNRIAATALIVSPGSDTDDRRENPFAYAEAGVPFSWRVALDPEIVIHTYRSHYGGYATTGGFRCADLVTVPGLQWAGVEVAALDE